MINSKTSNNLLAGGGGEYIIDINPNDYSASNPYVAPTGRKYYRHSSGMGTVMVWNDNGVERETLILDMQYHNVKKYWGALGIDVSGITDYTSAPFKNQSDNNYILGSSNTTPSAYYGQTDAVLDAKFNWRDKHTSKENTDAFISDYPSSSYAANFCRSVTVNGVGCDLPNMQTLVRIFCDRAVLHAFDATDTNDYWSSWFNVSRVWNSSEYHLNYAWGVFYDGFVYYYYKDRGFRYVVPILEL